jgi:cytochrome oxidase assembly protein ShyY1
VARPPVSYRFVWSPRWIASHVFVLACVVAFINLGFWQLSRREQRQQLNTTVAARMDAPVVSLASVVAPGDNADAAQQARYRDVMAEGTYLVDEQVRIANRSNEGAPGWWIVTPLDLGDGTTVLVNRGWVPLPVGDGSPDAYAPPSGPVRVTGLVRTSQGGLPSGSADVAPTPSTIAQTDQVDLATLALQTSGALFPVYLDLQSQDPAQTGELPLPVPRPELNDGPHLSYAMQWFTFALLTCIVYPLLLRRVAHQRAAEASEADQPHLEPAS